MFNKLKLVKAVVYRFYSSIITFIIAYLLTKNLLASISIGIIDSLIKIFSYYAFDEIWDRITGFKVSPAVVFLTGLSGAGKTTIAKRDREKAKQVQRRDKDARREQRKTEKPDRPSTAEGGEDPDLAGLQWGPQEPLY